MKKIGNVGSAGHSLSAGHQSGKEASLKELWQALRGELDAVKADNEPVEPGLD